MPVPSWVVFLAFIVGGIGAIVGSFFAHSLALMSFGIWAVLVSGVAFIASRTYIRGENDTVNAVMEGMPSWIWWTGAALFLVAGIISVLEWNAVLAFPIL